MRILLDTHIFLWAFLSPEKLGKKTIDLLEDKENEKFLSAASSWEITIKFAKGSLILPDPPKIFVSKAISEAGIKQIQITVNDTLHVSDLPFYHKDPFDRLLITQAQAHDLHILTDDRVFDSYDVDTIRL